MRGRVHPDVLVVGGGTAGCVVAARVAERAPGASVLLVEAGPDLRSETPGAFRDGWSMLRGELDWGYASEPAANGAEGEPLRRLKVLGGTSSIVRFAVRGSPADFEAWRDLGNPGWGWSDVLPWFRTVETDLDFGEKPWHGDRGPIPVSRYLEVDRTEAHEAAIAAAKAVGFEAVDDLNAPGAVGLGPMPMSSRDGIRMTTLDAYLGSGRQPSNLAIRPGTEIAAVVLDGSRAVGVRTVTGEEIRGGAVVLSAGTYGSPAILMRSGIGPAAHLAEVGLRTVVDLPGVGENLADHPGIDVPSGYRGAVRTTPRLHSLATFRSSVASSTDAPDLLLWIQDPFVAGDDVIFEADPILMTPRSRGTVRLRSAVPTDAPRITLPGLAGKTDAARLAEAYERAWDLANRPEMRAVCAAPAEPDLRGTDLEAEMRARASSYPHVVGTCAMGPRAEDGAVVDAEGRVHGVDALSVVDASIFPRPTSGFPHLITIMAAEKLAAAIAARLA